MGKRQSTSKQIMAANNISFSFSQSTVTGQPTPTKVGVVFVMDRSGSMTCGGKLDAALNGAKAVTDQVVAKHDVVTFWSFDHNLTLHFQGQPKKRINWNQVETEIKANNGGTKLYDSIVEVVDGLPKGKDDCIWDVVVLTDGSDVHSVVHTAETVKAKLSNPGVANFNAILLGVGLESATEAVMRDMCAGDNCIYLPVGASASAIADAFHTVTAQVQEHRVKFTAEISGVGVDGMGGMDLSNLFQALGFGGGGGNLLGPVCGPKSRRKPKPIRKQGKQKKQKKQHPRIVEVPDDEATTSGPVCRFFNTAKGCKKGENCTFRHVPAASKPKPKSKPKKTPKKTKARRLTTCYNCGLTTNGPDAHFTGKCHHPTSPVPMGGYACQSCSAVDAHWSNECPLNAQ